LRWGYASKPAAARESCAQTVNRDRIDRGIWIQQKHVGITQVEFT
jgi:hypothetical protein